MVDEGCERRSSAAGDADEAGAGNGAGTAGMSDEVAAKRQRSRDSAAAMQPLPLPEVRFQHRISSAKVQRTRWWLIAWKRLATLTVLSFCMHVLALYVCSEITISTGPSAKLVQHMDVMVLQQGMGDAAAAAAMYAADMAEMKALLADHGVDLPRERFDGTDAELFRFAATMGLLKARTPAERCVRQDADYFNFVQSGPAHSAHAWGEVRQEAHGTLLLCIRPWACYKRASLRRGALAEAGMEGKLA